MSRSISALLLLLGLAGTDSTIDGHTSYPVDSVRVARTNLTGLTAGLVGWPIDGYCGGTTSGTMQSVDPRVLLSRVQLAARCGFRLVIVPPRRMLTENGRAAGIFSVDSARRLIDRYAAELPSDTLRKYRATILGLTLADDYACTDCWGGKTISQKQVTVWAAYARGKLPGVPLGVRVTPDWVEKDPLLAPLLDYAWAQYHTRKGDPRKYYDTAATIAERLGLQVVMGVNVEDCAGPGTSACVAAELTRLGTMAVTHPASCAFLSWRYDDATWQQADVRAAWDRLLALAKARPARECRAARNVADVKGWDDIAAKEAAEVTLKR